MKTLTTSIVIACLCQLFVLKLSAQTPPGVTPQSAQASESASLADQANTKLQQATSQEDYREAAGLLAKAASLDPNNLDARKTLGWVYLDKLHEPHLAYPYLVPVAAGRPNDADAHKLLGMASAQTGRLHRAVDEFRTASRLEPADLWIRANLARNLARLGHYGQAERIYADILKTDPNNQEARLGEAEIAAWRGRSAAPLQSLEQILKDNPTNADALVLAGDIHRWNWDLAEARTDYQQALQAVPDDTDAKNGLDQLDLQQDSNLTLKGYYFKDNTAFARYSTGVDSRWNLTDRLYLLAGADGWRFTNPGFDDLDSIVAHAGLEYHFNRYFEASAEGTSFDYDNRTAIPGARVSFKITPFQGLDIYTVGSYQDPFVSSMPTVVEALKQDSVGNGINLKLVGPLSFQNSLEVAAISDQNNWWEEKPQLSFHVLTKPLSIDLRAQYDHLSYSEFRTNYWTPNSWNTASPIVDISIPLCRYVHIEGDGQMPFVFTESRFGYEASGGPVFDIAKWCQFKISYIYAKIPGAISGNSVPWSGHGGQFSFVFRF